MPVIDINYDKFNIGSIEFSEDAINEARISSGLNISGLSKAEIYVYGNEGSNLPHLHIVSNGYPDICVMLMDNRYFSHGKNKGTMTSKQCQEFNQWMKQKNKKSNGKLTNWQACVLAWNMSSDTILNMDSDMPDYSIIKSYR